MRAPHLFVITSIAAAAIAGGAPPMTRGYTDKEWEAVYTKFVQRPFPVYPDRLRALHLEGGGVFRLYVDPAGQVKRVDTLKSTGDLELDAEAKKALIRWKAKPAAKSWVADIPLEFYLPNRHPKWSN